MLRTDLESALRRAKLESEAQQALATKLRYLNEFSLRGRLRDILRRCASPQLALIGDEARFIRSVVDTRNYLTHFDQDLEHSALTGASLHYLSEQVKAIIEYVLLLELGLPDELAARRSSDKLRESLAGTAIGQ